MLYLVGVSFGGMVALEAARGLHPRAVILIASTRSPANIRKSLKIVVPIMHHVPAWMIRCAVRCSPKKWRAIAGGSPALFKWGPAAMARWTPSDFAGIPVFHIHGQRDKAIPWQRAGAHSVVAGAGHFLNVTHGPQVNQFIIDAVRQVESDHAAP